MIYQYLYNLADFGTSFSMINQVASEYKYYKDNGVASIRSEVLPAWGYHGPSLYLASKMMWDADLDAQALMDEYFATFYGPAGDAMQLHFEILEAAYANADYFAGSAYEIPKIITSESYVQKLNGQEGDEEEKSCREKLKEELEEKIRRFKDKLEQGKEKIRDQIENGKGKDWKDFHDKLFGKN